MGHRVESVDANSAAARMGIRAGDILLSVNGQEVQDIIDYEYLTTNACVTLELSRDGRPLRFTLEKQDPYEPLGLNFASGLMSPMRRCKNHCVFCFIDQLPRGGRETLHEKDDDWRLSLIMGNYVTLTNVDEAEFERIIMRRVSPLYISVHAMDPEVRRRMMRNPTAGLIAERLARLKAEGLRFCAQIVLCPELNDGEVLRDTLSKLSAMQPEAISVAVVPVGLTRYREGLYPLRPLDRAEARETLALIHEIQRQSLAQHGTRFAFASDELYILAGEELPPAKAYEDYSQIENGVGLIRRFEEDFFYGLEEHFIAFYRAYLQPRGISLKLDCASGVYAAPFLREMFARLKPYGVEINVHAIKNAYFGEAVMVAGLVTAGDIIAQLGAKKDTLTGRALLIPSVMLREREDVFLDGGTPKQVGEALGMPVVCMPAGDGEAFIERLIALIRELN